MKRLPVEHLLAIHELHELAHWALEDGNGAIQADHAEQWNERLSEEVEYITGDNVTRALWKGR